MAGRWTHSMAAGAALWGLASGAAQAEPFVFVALPDTQVYAEDREAFDGRTPAVTDPRGTGAIFFDQTRWIVENAKPLGIRYVGHLGDIVQDGNDLDEWALAHEAMDLLLEADIPHGTVMGNHDDNHGPDYMRNYLDHFGPQHFDDRPWFTASSPGGGANLQILEHEHRRIGFLNFSIDQPRSEIDWATGIVEANPDTIFIVGTHRYLYDFKLAGGRYGERVSTPLGPIELPGGPVPGAVDPTSAEEFFQEFVTQHPNILMVHAGHFHAEWLRWEDDQRNAAGLRIIQILTDYQSTRNGGDGWLRLYELDFEEGRFAFDTYSPTLERWRSTLDHFVETIHLAWDQRDQVMDVLGVDETLYLGLLELVFKDQPDIPDGFLLAHPDFDEPEERAYFERYLDELFMGDPPPGFEPESIAEWEGLWRIGFAANPDDLTDFSDSVRSPRFALEVDFSQYFTPSPAQLVAFAFEDLLDALHDLDDEAFLFRAARRVLVRSVEKAFRHAEKGRPRHAARILEDWVLPRTDGCAAQGRPDPFWWFWWFWSWFTFDWIDDCAAQAEIEPRVLEVLDRLADAEPAPRGK